MASAPTLFHKSPHNISFDRSFEVTLRPVQFDGYLNRTILNKYSSMKEKADLKFVCKLFEVFQKFSIHQRLEKQIIYLSTNF